jgi:hypothetical protein
MDLPSFLPFRITEGDTEGIPYEKPEMPLAGMGAALMLYLVALWQKMFDLLSIGGKKV